MSTWLAFSIELCGLLAEEVDFYDEPVSPGFSIYRFFSVIFPFGFSILGALWLWMLIDCLRHEEDRQSWLGVLIILWAPGAVAYFFLRWLPRQRRLQRSLFGWLTHGRKIGRLQAAAHHIGNCNQFVELGEALREVGRVDEARTAFQKALAKDPGNLQALWGAARVEEAASNYSAARQHLQAILDVDSGYKFGDVSLTYGRVLVEMKDSQEARIHLERHVSRWPDPEAIVRLAVVLIEQGESGAARTRLQGLLLDM
ncbi:MAG: tetratricopeptide repeat protein, partial [Pirellulaceae bacterium]